MANIERMVRIVCQLDELDVKGTFDNETFGTRMMVGHVIVREVWALMGVIQEGDKS